MSDNILVDYLKHTITPSGEAPVVRLANAGAAYFDVEFVHSAIEELGRRLISHHVSPISPLECLAVAVLFRAANIHIEEEREAALEKFRLFQLQQEQEAV